MSVWVWVRVVDMGLGILRILEMNIVPRLQEFENRV
jgi:hypothetical protein